MQPITAFFKPTASPESSKKKRRHSLISSSRPDAFEGGHGRGSEGGSVRAGTGGDDDPHDDNGPLFNRDDEAVSSFLPWSRAERVRALRDLTYGNNNTSTVTAGPFPSSIPSSDPPSHSPSTTTSTQTSTQTSTKHQHDAITHDGTAHHGDSKESRKRVPLPGIRPDNAIVNVVLLRNDLRVLDQPAFSAASRIVETTPSQRSGPERQRFNTVAVFFWTPETWRRHNIGPPRIDFIRRSIVDLSHRLWTDYAIPLLVPETRTTQDQVMYLHSLMQRVPVRRIYCTTEYELNESRRDAKLKERLGGTVLEMCHDQCVVPPDLFPASLNVFNQYKNRWMGIVQADTARYLSIHDAPYRNDWTRWQGGKCPFEPDHVPEGTCHCKLSEAQQNIPALWPAGEYEAHLRLELFAQEAVHRYAAERNSPSKDMTAKISPYLSTGTISARHCILRALKAAKKEFKDIASVTGGAGKWIAEVIWRDFYRFIMFRHPRICKYKSFMAYGDHIKWRDADADFEAWCYGRTGFPIVDAAMRQLLAVGWMHNRLRMLVASFLSKHLLIDWKKGEKWFSEHLVDIDLASNNGGWQWSASVGVDPHEWIRVLSPLLQSEKVDADGIFIRRWVPELRKGCGKTDTKVIHDPCTRRGETFVKSIGYVKPIVDHKHARERAMEAYKLAKEEAASAATAMTAEVKQ